jgi:hypothetical protein
MKGEVSRAGTVEDGPHRAAEVGVGVVEGDRVDLAVQGVADDLGLASVDVIAGALPVVELVGADLAHFGRGSANAAGALV